MRVSLAERGGLSIISRSGGLKDRAVAGRPRWKNKDENKNKLIREISRKVAGLKINK